MGFLFEKLEVYRRAIEWGERIESLCDPISSGNRHLTDQLRRAALSISLNIAEGSGRWHKRDKKHFYLIARGSAYECVPILDLLHRKKLLSDSVFGDLRNEIDIIAKMLTKLIQSVDM
jgi:four helix bundle protein